MPRIYMLVGCPGAGKTWITEQVKGEFHLVHHDLFVGMAGDAYLRNICHQAKIATKPLLIEAPFSVSEIKTPLERLGHEVVPLFIDEPPALIAERYLKREGKPIPAGHLTRQRTYRARALKLGAFFGSTADIVRALKRIAVSRSSKPPQPPGSPPMRC